MLTAIVADDTGSLAALNDKVQSLLDHTLVADVKVLSTDAKPDDLVGGEWIQAPSLIEALEQSIESAAGKRIVILSSALTFQGTDLARFVGEIESTSATEHLLAITSTENGAIEIPDLSTEGFISVISSTEIWPLFCVATTRSACRTAIGSGAQTIVEFLTQALVRAIGDGDSIRVANTISAALPSSISRSVGLIEADGKARILAIAVDAMNIEELFPSHPWNDFSEESAAAAYHSLAALFLRFGDADSAIESLSCSEQLEESPRFFALKGLIQEARGETLEAVANMVASLQCYEARKVQDGKHYLSFQPRNIEIINSKMVDGLNALNTRDNSQAIEHFSEAVFQFDPFYSEYGVQGAGKLAKS